jgi:xanthine dehydrogenase accessory factor
LNDIFEQVQQAVNSGRRIVLATVVDKKGHGPAAPGARMIVNEDGSSIGTVGGGALEKAALKTAEALFDSGRTDLVLYNLDDDDQLVDATETGMVCGGSTTIYFELMGDSPHLVLIGAGHVGQAILAHAALLGFRVTLSDSRKGLLDSIRYRSKVHLKDYRDGYSELGITNRSYVVICTHSHAFDAVAMDKLYSLAVRPTYIGVLASRKKAETMVPELKNQHPEADLSNLYMPVGLKIGGPAPQEIAISVLAEIQAIRYGQTGQNHMGESW